ncbi:MAG: AMP-binding protein [Anaerotardibacter sp.]
MISTLTKLAQRKPEAPFFYAQLDSGSQIYTYGKTQFVSASLAQQLVKKNLAKDGYLACNMFNGPEFVFLVLAVAYAGITLAVMNPRLSEAERKLRKVELENACSEKDIPVLEERDVRRLILEGTGLSLRDLATFQGPLPSAPYLNSLDFARKCVEEKRVGNGGIIMFTSGSSGTPKATKLSWKGIIAAAKAANETLNNTRKVVWQLVLPMCHIGGMQILVRSLLNENPFILYSRYQPNRILNDVLSYKVTHISVVDKILQDLLENDRDKIIGQYKCILLGGAGLNEKTLKNALRAKAKVYASYGMTETSSMIACAKVGRGFDGGLEVLPGYSIRVFQPDKEGVGQLQVKGPGIFEGYLNARMPQSLDGFFVTGDRASVDKAGRLHMHERVKDLIISGGENIYPAEIKKVLLGIPGVKDAYVFGTPDETWGYRPVAFVEADFSPEAVAKDYEEDGLDFDEVKIKPANCAQEFARHIHEYLTERMSKLHHPKHVFVLKEFPRTGVGKVDAQVLKRLYDLRIDIKEVSITMVKQPFIQPIKTAKTTIDQRISFFVEVKDWAGRTGIAECVSFDSDWYLPEIIQEDYEIVKRKIAKVITRERYMHPAEVARSLNCFPVLDNYPMAKAAVEPAIWDLYGKITGKPLSVLINEKPVISTLIAETTNAQSDDMMQVVGLAKHLKGAQKKGGAVAASAATSATAATAAPAGGAAAQSAGPSAASAAPSAPATNVQNATPAEFIPKKVPGGVVIGIKSTEETLEAVRAAVEAGYSRVKIKISPESCLEKIKEVRKHYPDVTLVLDANQSFTEDDAALLKEFDSLNIACIEEPLDPQVIPYKASEDIFARLSSLQRALKTPIALDESIATIADLDRATKYNNLSCYVLKIAKLGGIQPALAFCKWAAAHGKTVWMGGMYDTGVSKRMHAAFETLPCIDLPGDISEATLYFKEDCAKPALALENGQLTLNQSGFEAGLGCQLNREYVDALVVDSFNLVG